MYTYIDFSRDNTRLTFHRKTIEFSCYNEIKTKINIYLYIYVYTFTYILQECSIF